MKKFWVLVRKEIRELLTPLMLVPLIITMAMFAFIGKIAGSEAEKAKQPQPIVVLDQDRSATSQAIANTLTQANFKVETVSDQTIDAVIDHAQSQKAVAVMVVPQGFEASLTTPDFQKIETYALVRNFSFTGTRNEQIIQQVVQSINTLISNQTIQAAIPGADPEQIKRPLQTRDFVVVGEKKAETSLTQVSGFISSQTFFIPIILFIVIVFAAQMVATSIAQEKENKTLETLLSVPVSRQAIVSAKLVAAGFVALLFAAVYMIGFRSYMNGVTGGGLSTSLDPATQQAITTLGLTFGTQGYVLLGISLFFGILAALSIALILGAFAEDVKGVQGVITPLMLLVTVPYFLVMFLDFSNLTPTLKYFVYAIPFSHPFLAAQNLLLGQTLPIIYGILYQAFIVAVFIYIASRIFSSDHIVTMKLNFKKLRKS